MVELQAENPLKPIVRKGIEMNNLQNDPHDTAIIVLIGDGTSDVVLIRSRSTGRWRFPGDRIREEDIDPAHPNDHSTSAGNAVSRITRERTGLTVLKMQRIVVSRNPVGRLFGFAGYADFSRFAARDNGECTKIVSLSTPSFAIPSVFALPREHAATFEAVLQLIHK